MKLDRPRSETGGRSGIFCSQMELIEETDVVCADNSRRKGPFPLGCSVLERLIAG